MTSPGARCCSSPRRSTARPALQTRQILDELPPLSDKIAIEEVNFVLEKDKAAQYGIDRVPAIACSARRRRRDDERLADPISRARRPATSSSRSSRRSCWSAARASSLTAGKPRRVAARRQAGDDAGVHDPDVTALSAGGQPRTRNGVRQPAHHRRSGRSHRVPRSRAALPRQRRAEDGRERRRSRFSAACRRTSSSRRRFSRRRE